MSTLNVVFLHFNKLQLLCSIFSYCSLIIDETEAENVLLKRNEGFNSNKRKFRFFPQILRKKLKRAMKNHLQRPRQSNRKFKKMSVVIIFFDPILQDHSKARIFILAVPKQKPLRHLPSHVSVKCHRVKQNIHGEKLFAEIEGPL